MTEEYCHLGCDTVQFGGRLLDVSEKCTTSVFMVKEYAMQAAYSLLGFDPL
jgi:hypothetical protein